MRKPQRLTNPLALGAYVSIAFLYFGLRPVLRPAASYVGTGVDPQIFIWSFAWWPHAIAQGINPFVTHAIWAPGGVNLAWTTSVPGLALLFAPLTWLVGPLDSFDVAAVLLPGLAAWTCFLLCRHLTRSVVPSLLGGYLFGFSSYMLGQQEGHMHLTSVFLIPLIALVLVRRLEGTIDRRRLTLLLGAMLALQLSFSTEVFFTLTLALGAGAVIAYVTLAALRPRLRALAVPLLASYLVAGLLTAPLLYYAATGFDGHSINAPRQFAADLLNLVVPTKLALVSTHGLWSVAARFPGNNSERGAYLGLPILVIAVLFIRERRREPYARFLAVCLATAIVVELGASLHVDGQRLVSLPLAAIDHFPLFDNVLPARISLFASLAAALIVASWSASQRSPWARYALPALAVVTLLPRPGSHAWITRPSVPGFITNHVYRTCLERNQTIVALPFGSKGDSMLWQAESGFWFRLAGGYLSPVVPRPYARFRAAHPSAGSTRPGDIVLLARAKHAGTIIVDQHQRSGLPLPPAGLRVASSNGVVVYEVPGAGQLPASC